MLPTNDPVPSEEATLHECDYMADDQQRASSLDQGEEVSEAAEQYVPMNGDLWERQPDYSPRGFDAEQMKQLYAQLYHHYQLMVEVYALTACDGSQQETAYQLGNLLVEYQVSHSWLSCRPV